MRPTQDVCMLFAENISANLDCAIDSANATPDEER